MASRDLDEVPSSARDLGFGHRIREIALPLAFLFGVAFMAADGSSAATVVVNDPSDTLHAAGCAATGTGTCTLRDAIVFANVNPGADEVHFAIPGDGVHTITLESDLPAIEGSLTIDGYTQPGASPNSAAPGLPLNSVLAIEINANGQGCLFIGGSGVSVGGLVINRCRAAGVPRRPMARWSVFAV